MSVLAEMARGAKERPWMRQSYSVRRSDGALRYLMRVQGYCCAWAAECLAHAFEPDAGPNRRHSQRKFTYVYGTAQQWGLALRAGGDCDKGEWVAAGGTPGPALQAGDMVFWVQGVNGYRYDQGHVAIVTEARAQGNSLTIVSENSSTRGIGTHAIGTDALSTMAGLMRWNVGEKPRELMVQMAASEEHCPMWMEGPRAVCNVRDLAEMLGYRVEPKHLKTQGKIYLVKG